MEAGTREDRRAAAHSFNMGAEAHRAQPPLNMPLGRDHRLRSTMMQRCFTPAAGVTAHEQEDVEHCRHLDSVIVDFVACINTAVSFCLLPIVDENRLCHLCSKHTSLIFMAALCNRGAIIFLCCGLFFFLVLSFFFFLSFFFLA